MWPTEPWQEGPAVLSKFEDPGRRPRSIAPFVITACTFDSHWTENTASPDWSNFQPSGPLWFLDILTEDYRLCTGEEVPSKPLPQGALNSCLDCRNRAVPIVPVILDPDKMMHVVDFSRPSAKLRSSAAKRIHLD